MEFRERIRALRLKRGLTQKQVAQAIGCRESNLWTWESGKAEPQLRYAIALAQFFHTTVEQLAGKPQYCASDEERLYKLENAQLRRALITVKEELHRQELAIVGTLLTDRKKG